MDKQLQTLIEPLVNDLGYEFVGLEFSGQGRASVLRIYIDQDSGIGLEDCEQVSREVSALLDVEDPIPGNYSLEISSPGLDRPLFSVAHYQRFAGEMAKLTTAVAINNRRRFKGVLAGVEQAGDEGQAKVLIDVEGDVFSLPFVQIQKARLVPQLD